MIKAIFWDIDGVLVESEPLHVHKITMVAATHGVTIKAEDWTELYGIGDKRVWEWLKNKKPDFPDLNQFLSECEVYYMQNAHTLAPRKGATEIFNHFASLGLPQAAVSSGIRTQVDANLDAARVKTRMLFSLSADEVTKTKPDPEPYNKAFSLLAANDNAPQDLKKDEILVIEDSPSGIRAGHAAGMKTIMWRLSPEIQSAEADHIVDTPEQFLQLVQQLAPAAQPPGKKPATKPHGRRPG